VMAAVMLILFLPFWRWANKKRPSRCRDERSFTRGATLLKRQIKNPV
jgi:hypothetical protein